MKKKKNLLLNLAMVMGLRFLIWQPHSLHSSMPGKEQNSRSPIVIDCGLRLFSSFLLLSCKDNVLSNSTSCFTRHSRSLNLGKRHEIMVLPMRMAKEIKSSIWGNSLLLHYLATTACRPHKRASPIFSTVICWWIYVRMGIDSSLALSRTIS